MKINITAILFLLFVAGNAAGRPLDEYLKMAAENNANLKSRYLQYQAALERVPQVGALPDPQLTFSVFIEPMERYMGDQLGSVSLMQMFPWFGTLSAAKDEMSRMAKAKFEEFNDAKSALFYDVRANWYALQLLEKEIAITKENIELLQTLERISLTRFQTGGQRSASDPRGSTQRPGSPGTGTTRAGTSGMAMQEKASSGGASSPRSMTPMESADSMGGGGTMIDVLRVQIEINDLQNNLALLEDSKIPLLARFNQFLNRPAHEPVVLSGNILPAKMPMSLSDIPDDIKKNNPMLLMLELEDAAFLARRKMNRKMGFPMIGLGVQYDVFKARDDMAQGRSQPMPMMTITLPIWRSKYNASVREADFLSQSAAKRKEDTANQLMVGYEEALKDYKDAKRREDLYSAQKDLANRALNILLAQYTAGDSRFEDVLRMQQQLLDYRLKYLDALIDGNIAVAMMERLMGR